MDAEKATFQLKSYLFGPEKPTFAEKSPFQGKHTML
jgi:hypothetical protein